MAKRRRELRDMNENDAAALQRLSAEQLASLRDELVEQRDELREPPLWRRGLNTLIKAGAAVGGFFVGDRAGGVMTDALNDDDIHRFILHERGLYDRDDLATTGLSMNSAVSLMRGRYEEGARMGGLQKTMGAGAAFSAYRVARYFTDDRPRDLADTIDETLQKVERLLGQREAARAV